VCLSIASNAHFAVLLHSRLGPQPGADFVKSFFIDTLYAYTLMINHEFPWPDRNATYKVTEVEFSKDRRLKTFDHLSGLPSFDLLPSGTWYVITESGVSLEEFFD
jgi:hypothetical protein